VLHGPQLALSHQFGFHPGTPHSTSTGQLSSVTSSGKIVMMVHCIEALTPNLPTQVVPPSQPIIDPLLFGPKHNHMAPEPTLPPHNSAICQASTSDASDAEDQADAESESSGSENDQGAVLT
jgi:hypothetical protein